MSADSAFYEARDLEALGDLVHYQRWIMSHFEPFLRGRVLEIGAGTGTFSQLYIDEVDEAVLLEPARNLTSTLQARFAGEPKVAVVSSLLNEAVDDPRLRLASFDAVLLVNVLEHVEDDAAMLNTLRSLLRPGGALLLFVPALQWIFGSLDSLLGHRRRYSLRPLRELIERSGFEVADIRYFDALGIIPWFVAGRVLRQRQFNAGAARIYDRTGVRLGALARDGSRRRSERMSSA